MPELMNRDQFRSALERAIQGKSANQSPFSIAWATGRSPVVGGKPSAVLAESLVRHLGLGPEQVAVVGDSPAEIALARHLGGTSVLVLSGAITAEQAAGLTGDSAPDHTLTDVADLLRHLTPSLTPSQD